jgi:hypothetical protein
MQPLPLSTVRQQVDYVLAHRQPGDVVVVGWAASFPFAYYWPERPTFAPTKIPTAVLFQVQYPDRDDLVLIGRTTRPDLVFGAVRERRPGPARAASGWWPPSPATAPRPRSSPWTRSARSTGGPCRGWPWSTGPTPRPQANLAEPLAEPCAADVVELAAKPDDAAESLPCSSRHRTPPTP